MKNYFYVGLVSMVILSSCSSSKTYFSANIRKRVEANSVPLSKIQYFIDRDVVLKRELDKGETKVASGAVKFENGHYVNIITLKKGTPGVCTYSGPDKVSISFEMGDGKFLNFGRTKAGTADDPYRILADNWVSDYGIITYEGKRYHIESTGTEAAVKIDAKWVKTTNIQKRQMKGRTVTN
ncbi:hypothetical protein [Ferruginibacter albus]|uniref:hypothetical protein n=1 Tax=Ferruginibacter albus TaxID=2875540 RepID=UPI001CC3389B|nr:hypothetical protein [Ferruginibacter albus]UAY52256.1 hypothetical protein K9M53_00845 [Ferruginibacter albus]